MSGTKYNLRPALPGDRDAAYAVCLQTGDAGADATALHTDPLALGHIYVGPYLRFEPELSFLLEDSQGVCGYVLGALDSERFYQRYQEEWLPELWRNYREPVGDPATWTESDRVHYEYFHPDIFFPPEFQPFPSHLHIDLIARAQGQGQGKRMVNHLLGELRRRGSPGVHLAMNALNHRAAYFYARLGFAEHLRRVSGDDEVVYLGRGLP